MMRAATFDDLPALVGLSRAYHAEAHGDLPFDPEYVAENFRTRTIDTMDGVCLCLEHEGEIVGYLAAAVSAFFSAPVKLAVELSWYVHPEHRGRGAAMILDYESWARERGCAGASLAMNEFPDPMRTEAMVRLYQRKGFRPYERGFLKRF